MLKWSSKVCTSNRGGIWSMSRTHDSEILPSNTNVYFCVPFYRFHVTKDWYPRTWEIQGAYTRSPRRKRLVMSGGERGKEPCTSIRPFIAVQNLFQLAAHVSHTISALVQTRPITGGSPTFWTCFWSCTDRFQLKFISRMKDYYEVNQTTKTDRPGGYATFRICGGVRDKEGRSQLNTSTKNVLINGLWFGGSACQDINDKCTKICSRQLREIKLSI